MNVNRLLVENTIPGDWVMLKMDVEGAECASKSLFPHVSTSEEQERAKSYCF